VPKRPSASGIRWDGTLASLGNHGVGMMAAQSASVLWIGSLMTAYDQSDLVKDLDRIFPEFASYWEKENEDEDYPSSTLHSVYMSFLPFLLDAQPTQKQWRLLAEHLSEAVAAGGDRENAVDTCVLEHLHQVKLNRILRPLLSKEAQVYVKR